MSGPMVIVGARVTAETRTKLADLAAEVSARDVTPTTVSTLARMAIEAGLPVVAERVRRGKG